MKKKMYKCTCRLCGIEWESTIVGGPKACTGCKSYKWRAKDAPKSRKATQRPQKGEGSKDGR